MSLKDLFLEVFKGRRHRREYESDYGIRGLYHDDAQFIRNATILSKWADVEYYGPGAAEANERRRQAIGSMMSGNTGNQNQDLEQTLNLYQNLIKVGLKRKRLTREQKLSKKLAKLEKEVLTLERKKKK